MLQDPQIAKCGGGIFNPCESFGSGKALPLVEVHEVKVCYNTYV